jgi:hypothetical protein
MDNTKDTRKKRYQKPKVARFSMRPDEAVLGNCKTTAQTGPSGLNCSSLGVCRINAS